MEEVGIDGGIKAHRWVIEIATDEEGVKRVETLRLSKASDSDLRLWPWMQAKTAAIRNLLLRQWLRSGRKSRVVGSWPEEGWLALELRTVGQRVQMMWLKRNDDENPLVVHLDVPLGPSEAAPFAASHVDDWLTGLRGLVARLPTHGRWRLDLTRADQSRLALYWFRQNEPDQVRGGSTNKIMIHMHALPEQKVQTETVWKGVHGEQGLSQCGKTDVLLQQVEAMAEPSLKDEVTMNGLIADLDDLTERAGLRLHALGVIARLGDC